MRQPERTIFSGLLQAFVPSAEKIEYTDFFFIDIQREIPGITVTRPEIPSPSAGISARALSATGDSMQHTIERLQIYNRLEQTVSPRTKSPQNYDHLAHFFKNKYFFSKITAAMSFIRVKGSHKNSIEIPFLSLEGPEIAVNCFFT